MRSRDRGCCCLSSIETHRLVATQSSWSSNCHHRRVEVEPPQAWAGTDTAFVVGWTVVDCDRGRSRGSRGRCWGLRGYGRGRASRRRREGAGRCRRRPTASHATAAMITTATTITATMTPATAPGRKDLLAYSSAPLLHVSLRCQATTPSAPVRARSGGALQTAGRASPTSATGSVRIRGGSWCRGAELNRRHHHFQ